MPKEDSVQQMWESLAQMMQERKQINAATLANRKALFFLGANAYGIVLNKLAADHKDRGDPLEEGGRRIREMFEEVERLTDLAIADMIPFMGGKTPTEGD